MFCITNTVVYHKPFTLHILFASQLAKKYHPDTNKDKEAEAKFQEIQQAYEVSKILFESKGNKKGYVLVFHMY